MNSNSWSSLKGTFQTQRWSVTQNSLWTKKEDLLAVEEPLEIRVGRKSIATTMRTPGNDSELAVGFLFSEGLLQHRNDLLHISHCSYGESTHRENIIQLLLAPSARVDFKKLVRYVFTSSSCGLCGKQTLESVFQNFPPLQKKITFPSPKKLFQISRNFQLAQSNFNLTGGLHAAGLFDFKGNLIVLREDIGRHNAVDKVLGYSFLQKKLPLESHILLVSGRASFEIMQKALSARIPIVAAISAPSSLAVEFAQESGQILIGFLRNKKLNVYSGMHRP